MEDFIANLLENEKLVTWILVAVGTLVTYVTTKLLKLTPTSWAAERIRRVGVAIDLAVRSVQQTYVDERRKARAPDSPMGTTLTDEEKIEAKKRVLEKVREYIGTGPLFNAALWILGFRAGVDPWISDVIESKVREVKSTGVTATPSSSNPLPPPLGGVASGSPSR